MQDRRRPLWPIGVMAAILICGARNSASCLPSTRLTPLPPSIPPRPTTYICRTCKRITTVLHFFPRKAYDFRGNFVSLQRDTQKDTIMEAITFTPAQVQVFNLVSHIKTAVGLEQLRKQLAAFYAKQIDDEMDALWESGEFDEKRLQELRGSHFRTPYKK